MFGTTSYTLSGPHKWFCEKLSSKNKLISYIYYSWWEMKGGHGVLRYFEVSEKIWITSVDYMYKSLRGGRYIEFSTID